MIRDIDRTYRALVPKFYAHQRRCADETAFKVPGTAFSTITLNYNAQLGCHTDANNLPGSFGNLVVLENGRYRGGYLCFPRYRIAVDVRTCDFLAMDINEVHCTTPMVPTGPEPVRLSVVCYMRKLLWSRTRWSTVQDIERVERRLSLLRKRYRAAVRSGGGAGPAVAVSCAQVQGTPNDPPLKPTRRTAAPSASNPQRMPRARPAPPLRPTRGNFNLY
jgi:hypothetical protein